MGSESQRPFDVAMLPGQGLLVGAPVFQCAKHGFYESLSVLRGVGECGSDCGQFSSFGCVLLVLY